MYVKSPKIKIEDAARKMGWTHQSGTFMIQIIFYVLFSQVKIPMLLKYEFKKKQCWTKEERLSKLYKNIADNRRIESENKNFWKMNNLNSTV